MTAAAAPLWRPSLWTPRAPRRPSRFGSWWRLPTLNLLQRDPDGVANRDPDGVAIRQGEDTPCCCNAGEPCSQCSGSTPAEWTFTLNSTTFCPCTALGLAHFTATGNLNGTFTVSQEAENPCFWFATPPCSISIHTFDFFDSTCASPDCTFNLTEFNLCLEVTAMNMSAIAWCEVDWNTVPGGCTAVHKYVLWIGNTAGAANCSGTNNLAAEAASCITAYSATRCGDSVSGGTNGTWRLHNAGSATATPA